MPADRREELNMYKRLELHNHTSESDGSLSCLELTEYMEQDGVDAFALTDHNTISGHRKVQKLLSEGSYHTTCIYGMEYTTYYGHILCFNLTEYVPWDSINFHKPELLFEAVKEKGGIAGIAHPFSLGAPFARGCRFEMTVHDYSAVDFIEVSNNPEPGEVNEQGMAWWESLVLSGHKLAATCGMDLHGKWELAGQYATFMEGTADGNAAEELKRAILSQRTWVSRGPLLLWEVSEDKKTLILTMQDTLKPGFVPDEDASYLVTLRSAAAVVQREIYPGTPLLISAKEFGGCVPGQKNASELVLIAKLYEAQVQPENLICLAPVIYF